MWGRWLLVTVLLFAVCDAEFSNVQTSQQVAVKVNDISGRIVEALPPVVLAKEINGTQNAYMDQGKAIYDALLGLGETEQAKMFAQPLIDMFLQFEQKVKAVHQGCNDVKEGRVSVGDMLNQTAHSLVSLTPAHEHILISISNTISNVARGVDGNVENKVGKCDGNNCATTIVEDGYSNPKYILAYFGGWALITCAILLVLRNGPSFTLYLRQLAGGMGLVNNDKKDDAKKKQEPSEKVTGPVSWFRNKDEKFKMNFMSGVVGGTFALVKFFQESNGMNPAISQLFFTQILGNLFGFFADLAVTGKMNSDLFNRTFLLQFAMFLVVTWLDTVITTSLVLFNLKTWMDISDNGVSPTKRGGLSMIAGFLTQQLYLNFLREQWVYPTKFGWKWSDDQGKTYLILAFVVIETLYYFFITLEFNEGLVKQMCTDTWNTYVGNNYCESVSEQAMLLCRTFCSPSKFDDEPICRALKAGDECESTASVADSRNFGYDMVSGLLTLVLGFLIFGALIPNNPISFFYLSRHYGKPKPQGDTTEVVAIPPPVVPISGVQHAGTRVHQIRRPTKQQAAAHRSGFPEGRLRRRTPASGVNGNPRYQGV